MRTIAIINQKGGCGKTTLAVHVAFALADAGRKVAFLDSDPQRSASNWVRAGAPNMPLEHIVAAEPLIDRLGREDCEWLVCDGSPRIDDSTKLLMYFADLILIPVLLSTIDVTATMEAKLAIDAVAQARQADGRPAPQVFLVLNKVRTVGAQAAIIRKLIRDLGLPMAQSAIGLRDAFAKANAQDTVVTRMKDKGAERAAQEIQALLNEVLPNELSHRTAA